MYNQDNYTRVLVMFGIVIFCLLFLLSGVDFEQIHSKDLIRSISSSTAITLLFHVAFKKWIWKYRWIPFINPIIVLVPNLHGTWKGKLQSSWVDPISGKTIDPILITAYIRQTFTSISVEVHTDQMISKSYIAGIRTDSDVQTQELCYTYSSKASADSIAYNPWHDGTAKLAIHNGTELRLKGDYWNLRKTIGTMELHRVSKKINR
ncbi:hypothetical protein [Paenibacillus sp. GbtcB18]|uniref:Cap15 family cyclic dinucleotide receptor domain-containing protein n=1 Tax=Paenibacillus sp. GbtcB18 TaxID=2824763 RepID=UPI001C30B55D|nr:hypothetical protein [Paenibacillus sp. GbtcB18]